MANPLLQTKFASADPNASPLSINELIDLLNNLTMTKFVNENSYLPYVIGHDTPSVDDQDKAWIQLDPSGNPIRINTFVGGNWRRVYNGMKGGEVRGFTGAPGYGPLPALFDSTGLGNITGEFDGWAICNGQNSTPDLSDRFLVGADMNNPANANGYGANGWQTFLDTDGDGTKNVVDNTTSATNGAAGTLIKNNNLPILDNSDPSLSEAPGLFINGAEYIGAALQSTPVPIVSKNYDPTVLHHYHMATYGVPLTASPGPQVPLSVLPPYYILAWITFVGY